MRVKRLAVEHLNLSEVEKAQLGGLRLDKPLQNLLKVIREAAPVPRYDGKTSPLFGVPDMIAQSGYRDGIEDVIAILSGKDRHE